MSDPRPNEQIAALPPWPQGGKGEHPSATRATRERAIEARLALAVAHIEMLAYGGFNGEGVIPRHYKNTWESTMAVIAACKEPA